MIVKDLRVFLCLVCMLTLPTHGMMNFSTDKTLCVRPYIVNIELDDQILIMDDQKKQCEIQIAETFADKTDHCPIMWDKVLCWPEAKLNQSIYLPCPNYINKFNTRNKASKRCEYDPIASRAHWSKTNFHECLSYSPKDYCTLTSCSMENHLRYIIIMRVVGYVASMLTLVFSIIILMRPRLRCPRNYVHINLFVAFALRTILVMAVDQITRNSPFTLPKKNSSDSSGHPYHHHPNVPHHNDADYTFCRSITVIFRYSGSVYHTAILSEALYLVLLLKYPYYSELKGSKFCILISWVLPILWMIPWTLSRVFVDDNWCWQAESNTNLIIKIPHSILLILNIVCAVFIIRILYSKMRFRNLNRENIKRYRRLAKSILILIPIFGLHFTFFAWLPYASLVGIEISDCFELVVTYIEIFFNAFQGFVVSLTSCLIHHEVRIEFILFTVEIMKKVKCLSCMPCMDCLESDYIRNIRYIHLDPRAASSTYTASRLGQTTNGNGNGKVPTANGTRRTSALGGNSLLNMSQIDEERPMLSNLPAGAQVAIQPKNKKRRNRSESSDSAVHTPVNKRVLIASQSTFNFENPNIEEANSCCFCLFGNQKNDFFREHRLHSSSGGGARKSLPQSQNDGGGGVEGADDVIEIGDNKRPSLFEKLMGKSKYPKGKKPPKTVTIAAVESSKLTSSNSLMADDNQVFEQNNTQTETRNTTNNNNISTIPSVNEIENEKPVQTVPVPVPVPITQDVNNTTPKFTLVMDDQNVPNNESDELQMNTEPTNIDIDSSIVQNTDNQEAMNVDENYTDKNIEDASLNASINEPISNSNQNSLTDYETSLVHDSTNNNPINDEHEQEQVKVIEHDATILQPLNDQDTSRISFEAEEIMKMSDAEFDDLIVNYSNLNSLTDYEMSLEHVKPTTSEQPPKKHRSKSMSDLVRSSNNDNQNQLFIPFKSYQTLCQSTNEQMQIPTNNNNTVIKYTDNLTGAGKNEPSEERINL